MLVGISLLLVFEFVLKPQAEADTSTYSAKTPGVVIDSTTVRLGAAHLTTRGTHLVCQMSYRFNAGGRDFQGAAMDHIDCGDRYAPGTTHDVFYDAASPTDSTIFDPARNVSVTLMFVFGLLLTASGGAGSSALLVRKIVVSRR